MADAPLISRIMDAAIGEILGSALPTTLLERSRLIMGLDRNLIEDRTYWIAERDGVACGCGGWSRRATIFGGDHTAGRDARLLDPSGEPARIRAMYTHPAHTRRGVGKAILLHCEGEARAQGFRATALVATIVGVALYRSLGYVELGRFDQDGVPLVKMSKRLSAETALQPEE